MLNYEKIENLKNVIINYINNTEFFDENYIFQLAKNYAKERQIEITKGEIKSIIYNILSSYKNNDKINSLNDSLYINNDKSNTFYTDCTNLNNNENITLI